MVKKILIYNLFGREGNKKEVCFNKDLTIIVGKNGSGKTTVLDILSCIMGKQFEKLFNYQFRRIVLDSDAGYLLIDNKKRWLDIRRLDIENVLEQCPEIHLTEGQIKTIKKDLFINNCQEYRNKYNNEDIKHFLSLISLRVHRNKVSMRHMERRDRYYADKFSFNISSLYFPTYRRIETDLMDLLKLTSENRYINRTKYMRFSENLFSDHLLEEGERLSNTIVGLTNKDIAEIIAKKWNEINEIEKRQLNALIQQFFVSLLDPVETKGFLPKGNLNEVAMSLKNLFTKAAIVEKSDSFVFGKIDKYVQDLTDARDYLENRYSGPGKRDGAKRKEAPHEKFEKAMSITLSYTKVNRLVEMYTKASEKINLSREPFRNICDQLSDFLNKEVHIEDGNISFREDGISLGFEDLSAGEKQLVALFIYTRLNVKENSVFVIDEPELSLHIGWQRKFLSALMSDSRNIQYIVSTHSPFVISHYRDKVEIMGDIGTDE